MKYLSLDLETTCVEKKNPHNIIGISCVVENTDIKDIPVNYLPHFTCLIDQHWWEGNAFALQMNAWLLKKIANKKWEDGKPYKILDKKEWVPALMAFLDEHFGNERITLAGKNVGTFDLQFLPEVLQSRFRARVLDIGSVFVDWNKDALPGMKECMEIAGVSGSVTHDMYQDACDNILVLRSKYYPKPEKV